MNLVSNLWQVLLSRSEVQSELVQQVLLLMAHNKQLGMIEVCEFLRPFLNYSILRIPFSDSSSSMFARNLISSMASLCCSLSLESIPVLKLLTEVLNYIPCKNSEVSKFVVEVLLSFLGLLIFFFSFQDSRNFINFVENIVDAHVVVLRHLAGKETVCSLDFLLVWFSTFILEHVQCNAKISVPIPKLGIW